MSEEVNLCGILLKQHFGDVVEQVGRYLIKGGAKSLRFISRDVNCSLKNIKKALCVLLHHNLAAFSVANNNMVQYQVFSAKVLLLSRYPKYCYGIKQLYGEVAEEIVKEILLYGRLEMSKTIELLGKRLANVTLKTIHDTFKNLVSTFFLKKCPAPLKSWNTSDQAQPSTVPNLEISEDHANVIVDINLKLIESNIKAEAEAKIKIEDGEETPPPAKRQKIEETQPDTAIYWSVNFERFHQLMRDQAIVKLAATRVDEFAGEIVRAILRQAERNTPYGTPSTNPISRYEIIDLIKKDKTSLSKDIDSKMDSYLAILVDDATKFVTKYDERSGGMFVIDYGKALQAIAEANVTSVVQDRYGSKCCRIFRLLLMKKYLDQKQIEEMSMIPAKDAKEYTYKLLKDNIIVTKEIPQTPDFAPSRTFFLFYVDLDQLGRIIIKWIYKAVHNAISRSMHEKKQNKRLLDKQVTVELIINKLQSENAMEEQIREMNDMITQPERELLNHLQKISLKLAASQMQLDDTLFVLTSYIESLIKFPIATGKKS